jgi:hypothetical protein
MMRWIVALALIVMLPFSARAEEDETASSSRSTNVSIRRTAEETKKKTDMRKLAAEWRKDLNGSQWEVTVSSQNPQAKGVGKDVLTFQNDQFRSRSLEKRGYSATNYTITPLGEEGERAVWETMQTGKDGVVFVKGEWKEEQMTGTMTEQLDGGKTVFDYYFTSAKRKKVAPTSEEEKAGAEDETPAPEVLTSSEKEPEAAPAPAPAPSPKPTKKRRGLISY